jgi:hypothetical protein
MIRRGGCPPVEGPGVLFFFFAVEDATWWWTTGGGPCVVFFFLLFSFVCHACQIEAHGKYLTLCRACDVKWPAIANGLPLGTFFCYVRAMTHGKGCLPCV